MRLPTDSEGILIAGRRGSGKTMEGLYHLSNRSIDVRPWVIVDFKGDDLASKVPVSAEWTLRDGPPPDAGLYVVRADIEDHGRGGPLDDFLLALYRRGQTGVMIDEGIMLGQHSKGLRTLLTQGRSRECPMIILTQRPKFLDRYAFSESEFIQCFHFQLPDDQAAMREFIPDLDFDYLRDLGQHHSMIYDIRENEIEYLKPCPDFIDIYDRILTRLPRVVDQLPPRRLRV